jgi:hypothetical protein
MREDFNDEADTIELGGGIAECVGDVGDDDVTVELPPIARKVLAHRRVLGGTVRRSRSSQ